MGDLKKKQTDYTHKISEDITIGNEIATDDRMIKRLKSYLEKFYDMQLEKIEKEEEDGEISNL